MDISEKRVKFGAFEGTLEEASCPADGKNAGADLVFRCRDGIGYYRCRDCNLMFASPRFTEESLMNIYETEAFADLRMFEDWSYEKWKEGRDRAYVTQRQKLELIRRYLPEGARLLDVGAGMGLFLLEARKEGFKCEGLEPSAMLSKVASEVLGVPVSTVEVEDFNPPYKFDGIVIWDVLEHLYDPVGVLKRCAELLEPGGYVFAQVPNHRGLSNSTKTMLCRMGIKRSGFKHFWFPWHVYSFDRGSLGALARAASLEPVLFESWSHLLKEGRSGPFSRTVIDVVKKLCISDYIVCVARKTG